jgi:glycosyltransferase involved in cell wall biosynthesis
MKVSVVIPVYNKAPFLRACLDSVFAQSFTDMEVIAVDDASTDDSLAVLRTYDDPRLRVEVLAQNRGPAGAAAHAMALARGAYIVRVDADDVLMPDRVRRQVAWLDAHPEVGVLGSSMRVVGDTVTARHRPTDDADLRARLVFGVAVFQPTSVYRTAVLRAHGLNYDPAWPRVGEDWLFQVRLARHTRFANLPEQLVTYRHGPQGVSYTNDRAAVLGPLIERVCRELGLPLDGPQDRILHAMGRQVMPPVIDAALVHAFRDRSDLIAAWNDRTRWTDPSAMRRELDRAWDALFHHLPAHGWDVVRAYRARGGRMDLRRWYYLVRSRMGGRGNGTSA